jgi:hypothetical protein
MKLFTLLLFSSVSLFVAGCESLAEKNLHEKNIEDWRRDTVLATGSEDDIKAEAIRDARSDIARGQPRIYYCAGGFVAENMAIGIPEESLPLVRDLPKVQLPGFDCIISKDVSRRLNFGAIYNHEILLYLLRKNK